jgi:hypothetical protein
VPLPALGVIRRQIDFARGSSEADTFPAEVQRAIEQHAEATKGVAQARTDLAKRMPAEMLASYDQKLADLGKELRALEASQVAIEQRPDVLGRITAAATALQALLGEATPALERYEAAEAATRKEKEDKDAADDRKAAFGENAKAFAGAQEAASVVAGAEFTADVAALKGVRKESEAKLPEAPKKKAAKPKGRQKPTKAATAAASAAEARKVGLENAKEAFETGEQAAAAKKPGRVAEIVGALGAVARSVSGKILDDDGLAWVMTASGGNAGFAQDLADIAASDPDVARAVAAGERPQSVAGECARFVSAGVPAAGAHAAARVLGGPGGAQFAPWFMRLAGTKGFGAAVDFAGAYPTPAAAAAAALVGPALGTGSTAYRFMDAVEAAKPRKVDIVWLLSLAGTPGYPELIQTITNRGEMIDVARVHQVFDAAGANFTLTEVATICNRNHTRLQGVLGLLSLPTTDAHCVSFIHPWLDANSKAAPEALRTAIRAEALLTDAAVAPAFTITIQQPDKDYGRGPHNKRLLSNTANDARTGFLTLNFPGGTGYLHTHWDAKGDRARRITSMHVQESATGDNGCELNKWLSTFPKLTVAAVAAQNTGAPTGGPVILGMT